MHSKLFPKEEKRIFTAAFLRRAIPFDFGPLDDAETAQAADQLFAELDAEENAVTPALPESRARERR